MGYYTMYELDVRLPDELSGSEHVVAWDAICTDFNALFGTEVDYGEWHGTHWSAYATMKWYDHEVRMSKLSRKHPGVVFGLTGYGEDNDDMWRKYFLNGMVQVCKARISFDPFDEGKMKKVIQ